MRYLITLIVLLSAAPAEAQCFGYRSYGHYKPVAVAHKGYDYTDNRFQVTYNVSFPAPAVSGATGYGYEQPLTYSFLDPAEAYRLKANFAQRSLEVGESVMKSADLLVQQSTQSQENLTKLALAKEFNRMIASVQPGGTSEFRASISRDAQGRVSVNSSGLRGGGSLADRITATVAAKCVSCHQPGGEYPKLDLRDLATLDPSWESEIVDRVTREDEKQMPPKRANKPLSAEQILDFHRAKSAALPPAGAPKQPADRSPAQPKVQ